MSQKHTSHDKIIAIVELYKAKKPTKEISAQTGVNIVTVRRLIRMFKDGEERELTEHKHGGGFMPLISPKTLHTIKQAVRLKPSMTAKQLKEKYSESLSNVAIKTIQDNLLKAGYKKVSAKRKPLVTAAQRKKRLAFANKYKDWPLNVGGRCCGPMRTLSLLVTHVVERSGIFRVPIPTGRRLLPPRSSSHSILWFGGFWVWWTYPFSDFAREYDCK